MRYTFESNLRVYFLTSEVKKKELFNILEDIVMTFPYRRYCFNNNGDFVSLEKPELSFKSINKSSIKNTHSKRETERNERIENDFKPSEFL